MPMSAAERQKKYREKLKTNNPDKWKQMKEENARRTKIKYKRIGKLSEIEKESRRKVWRKTKQKYDKIKSGDKMEIKDQSRKYYQKKYSKKYRRLNKELKKAYEKMELLKRRNETLRKKLYRYKLLQNIRDPENKDYEGENVYEDDESQTSSIFNPNLKTDLLLNHLEIPSSEKEFLRKELLEKYVLEEAMKVQYKTANINEKRTLKKVINNDIVRKHKMTYKFKKFIGLKAKARISNKHPVKQKPVIAKIRGFFLQDDVSRATAGKKETKTYRKNKMQRRYLLDHMKNLRLKFIKQTKIPVSYTTFTRYKPFFVLSPNLSNRDTCACKKHANIEFKFTVLKRLSVLKKFSDIKDVLKSVVCNTKSKLCMYSECDICKEILIDYDLTETHLNKTVTWIEWVTKEITYVKGGQEKKTKRVQKILKRGELKELISTFEKELQQFKTHCFNISHQYNAYIHLIDNLCSNEMMIHCDFSENYTAKGHTEIQAAHFGASQNQISLHTSMLYTENNEPESFCTLSDSGKHTPEAICFQSLSYHLLPILSAIREKSPEIDTIHVYSDGPSSQYRQKKNFYLFIHFIKNLGFAKATWNFSEAAHGKGAADGVGASIKRRLDHKVAHGLDILDAESAFEVLNGGCTKVTTYLVSEKDIEKIEELTKDVNLSPIPQTFKIHQVMAKATQDTSINYRQLSCFCGNVNTKGFCECYNTKTHKMLKEKKLINKRRVVYSSSEDEKENKVVVLSNVKINFNKNDLNKILKRSDRHYNVSSTNIIRDFKELLPTPAKPKVERRMYLSDFNLTDSDSN